MEIQSFQYDETRTSNLFNLGLKSYVSFTTKPRPNKSSEFDKKKSES